MAITSYSRIQRRGFNFPTSGITVAPSNDHTDGTWSETDAYSGEITINTNTGKLQYISSGTVYTVISDIQNSAETPTKSVKVVNTTFGNREVNYFAVQNGGYDLENGDIGIFTIAIDIGITDFYSFDMMIVSDDGEVAVPYNYNANYSVLSYDTTVNKFFIVPVNFLVFTSQNINPNGFPNSGQFTPHTFTAATLNTIISYLS